MTTPPSRRPALLKLVFAVYVVLRLAGWYQVVLLEDHDSLGYLTDAAAWRSLDPARIGALSPDSTPLFPIATAVASLPGSSLQAAGRLVSFASSILLFVAVLALGRSAAGETGTLIGLALLAVNPTMIGLSFAVLSEPVYVAIVYAGFWLYLSRYEHGGVGHAAATGAMFACAFLDRTEGIFYVGLLPALHGLVWLLGRRAAGSLRAVVRWCALYVVTFAALALPQIVSVSLELGAPAINGRQVWMAMMNADDGLSSDAKVYGLDYAAGVINLDYLQSHPEAVASLASGSDRADTVRIVAGNLRELARGGLVRLIGAAALACAAIGGAFLASAARRHDGRVAGLWLAALLGSGLLGPLLYNVATRHIAILAPALCLLAGLGVVRIARALPAAIPHRELVVGAVCVTLTLAPAVPALLEIVVDPPRFNNEYAPDTLVEPARIARDLAGPTPRICARKGYLAHAAGGTRVALPYTDLDGLYCYMALNDLELLYLNSRLTRRFPFDEALVQPSPPVGLELLWAGRGPRGERLRLMRVAGAPLDPRCAP